MKRLIYLLTGAFNLTASAQSYSIKNVNEEYFVSSIYNADISKNNLHEFLRDKNGLYWFQYLTEVYSFDGVNWKSYKLKSMNGSSNPFRINDIETTDDGSIWLATEHGIFVFDPQTECFIPVKQKFPAIKDLPPAVTCFFQGPPGTIILLGFQMEGFYLFDWKSKTAAHIIIDRDNKVSVSSNGLQITADRSGNIWGSTSDNRGIWNYNQLTGKIRCSWKGELPEFAGKRFQNFASFTYSENENTLWISHRTNRYVEKMNLKTGKSIFYSFSGNLKVQADTCTINKYEVFPVKIDRDNNEWVNVAGRYIVRLNKDISKMECLVNDPGTFPIGEIQLFKPETGMNDKTNNILLWVLGMEKISMIKKRGNVVRNINFDTLSVTGIKPEDFLNTDARQNIFFEKGRNDQYFLLQQNPGRPKLICLDRDLRIKKALFNDEWKQYPAFFSHVFDPDTFYIALLRPEVEPLDFRNVVLKDFRVDLHTFNIVETHLDFRQRIWRYGYADRNNVYWLFSDGSLYSYDPVKDILDSIFICEPAAKGSRSLDMIKGYDYPTVLHKSSSTFWIDFFPVRQLYKINLVTKRIDKIFKTCLDQMDCNIPGGVYNMYTFDSTMIYLKSGLFGMLLNTKTDSVTGYSELFKKKLPAEGPCGSGVYGDWICLAFPSYIYLLNRISGKQMELIVNEDFKWKLSSFHSRPLVNDHGEMIFMSSGNQGFLVLNIDSATVRRKPGIVNYSFVKVDNKSLLLDSLIKNKGLILKYNNYSSIQIAFSDYSIFDPEKTSYEYALYKQGDTIWSKIEGKPELTLSELSSGKYQLLLRASNAFGDCSEKVSAFNIVILPPFWQTWWFRALVLAAIGTIFYGLYRYRMQQVSRLQIIRNNIASDLHDDIGSTLNSISIYSEVAKQQAGKEIPALDLIGMNSRTIIENMSDIVWTINPGNDSFEKIIARMRSFAYQLLKAKKIEYTFEVDEKMNSIVLPMQVRKNFYLVFKEAVTNIIKYSAASRVSILLYAKNKIIVLRIRDNGRGLPVNAETQGNGLLNMSRRATEINAELSIVSPDGGGTEIELMLKN